jgi:hypothetical protein
MAEPTPPTVICSSGAQAPDHELRLALRTRVPFNVQPDTLRRGHVPLLCDRIGRGAEHFATRIEAESDDEGQR